MRALHVALVLCLLPAAGWAAEPTAAQSALAEKGRELFKKYCSSCHGDQGQGDGPIAESLKARPADLSLIAARRDGKFEDAEIRELIDGRKAERTHGPREMPVWGAKLGEGSAAKEVVVRSQLTMILAYLRSLQAPAKP